MGVGEHITQGTQPLRAMVDEQCEQGQCAQGAESPSFVKFCTDNKLSASKTAVYNAHKNLVLTCCLTYEVN